MSKDSDAIKAIEELFSKFEKSGPPWNTQQSKIQYEGLRDYFEPHLADLLTKARLDEISYVSVYTLSHMPFVQFKSETGHEVDKETRQHELQSQLNHKDREE